MAYDHIFLFSINPFDSHRPSGLFETLIEGFWELGSDVLFKKKIGGGVLGGD